MTKALTIAFYHRENPEVSVKSGTGSASDFNLLFLCLWGNCIESVRCRVNFWIIQRQQLSLGACSINFILEYNELSRVLHVCIYSRKITANRYIFKSFSEIFKNRFSNRFFGHWFMIKRTLVSGGSFRNANWICFKLTIMVK